MDELLTSTDGTCLNYKIWKIENPRFLLCISHGLGEHIDRYDSFARIMNDNGIAVSGMDYRGHGKSEGKKGHSPSFQSLLDDFNSLVAKSASEIPEVPLILFGHSMGGNVLANYLNQKKESTISDRIKGAIISSPWLELEMTPSKIEISLASGLSKIIPSFTLPNRINPEKISSDPVEVEKYIQDPLVHGMISLKLFTDVYIYGQTAIDNAPKTSIDCYVYHGSDDKVTSQKASERYATHLQNGTYKIWEGLRHEPHNDVRKDEVIQSIIDWIYSSI